MKMEKICSFTGHRFVSDKYTLKAELKAVITGLIKDGYTVFCNGGALGFDSMCALAVLELKKEYDISLNMILPCENQDMKWNEEQKKVYKYILNNCDSIEYVSKEYTNDCMLKRNRVLCEKCDMLLAYCNKPFGGSFYTVKYAEKIGKKVYNIAAKTEG